MAKPTTGEQMVAMQKDIEYIKLSGQATNLKVDALSTKLDNFLLQEQTERQREQEDRQKEREKEQEENNSRYATKEEIKPLLLIYNKAVITVATVIILGLLALLFVKPNLP